MYHEIQKNSHKVVRKCFVLFSRKPLKNYVVYRDQKDIDGQAMPQITFQNGCLCLFEKQNVHILDQMLLNISFFIVQVSLDMIIMSYMKMNNDCIVGLQISRS